MKTLFKTYAAHGSGFYGDVVLYLTEQDEFLLYVAGKKVWASSSLPSQAIDGTGWAEAAFDESGRRQHFGVGSGGAGRTGGGGGVSPDAAVIHGTSGRGFWDPSLLNIET